MYRHEFENPKEMLMPFGVHQGKPLKEIPIEYLRWVKGNCNLQGPLKSAVAALVGRTCSLEDYISRLLDNLDITIEQHDFMQTIVKKFRNLGGEV